jgi:chemotaxis protein methyltransferase WspC
VYLDPMHDEALLALALLAERRGDHDAASGFRRRAKRSVPMSRKLVN